MAAALTCVDFRNTPLVQAKCSRNVVLMLPAAEAHPDVADRFVSQLIGHEIISIHGDLKA